MAQTFESVASSLFEMKGKDARDFLHRLTTINANAMQTGESAVGFFLTAQGKILAHFGVLCAGEENFKIDCPDGRDGTWKQALLSTIDRFTFTEKYTLTEIPALVKIWIAGDDAYAVAEKAVKAGLTVINWKTLPLGIPTFAIYGEKSALAPFATGKKSHDEFEKLRISSVRPGLNHEITLESNPLEIGMRDAIADQKGCYPGQEVIEKIIALGSPARGLVLIEGAGSAPTPGEKVLADGGIEVGAITSTTKIANRFQSLAILRKTHLKPGLELRFSATPGIGQIGKISQNS